MADKHGSRHRFLDRRAEVTTGGVSASTPMSGDESFGLPPEEVSTAEAADILGVSKDTVFRLKAAGLLEYRNTGAPGSRRPVYAFTLRSVMAVRTTYKRDEPIPRAQSEPPRRAVRGEKRFKHLRLE